MKKWIGMAALGCAASAAHAQSSVTLYGIIDSGITYVNHAATAGGGHGSLVEYGDGVAQGSRWGIRGAEDLGGGLKTVFALESGFSSGNGTLGQGGALFGREAFVGLSKRGIGMLSFGRQYALSTEYIGNKYTMGNQTVVGNYAFHINDLDQLTSSRINNSVKFDSANFDGFTFGALYGFSNEAGDFAGTPTTTTAGTTKQGSSSTYSFGVNYENGSFGLGTAYTSIRYPNAASPAFSVSVANVNTGGLRDLSTFGIGSRYRIGDATVWGNWTHTRLTPLVSETSTLNNYEIGAKYQMTTASSVGLGYTFSDMSGGFNGKWNQINSDFDYALSKQTDVYLLVVYQKAAGSNVVNGAVVPVQAEIGASTSFIGDSGSGASSQLAVRVGFRHRF
ncbi:porin [Burkholderia sp. WAC0059]|uniref:porin n=1 Tax=Burkholderia sp. WAC0059 TaxID=2066022 RepID=UPI000C7F6FF8|nr:porin [Burkholderia sp. WAC0059]PLZ02859.1 porin [Burkholderia sp. WAC0059]